MKKPTNKQKIDMYEAFLHKINLGIVCCNNLMIQELVANADRWSYAHRSGNGEISDSQQDQRIYNMFQKLCDTPEADKATEAMKQKRVA